MNEKVFVAKISWLTADQGGRKQGVPLYNDKYCPIKQNVPADVVCSIFIKT